MTNALIGHTGFVGSNLLRQDHFEALYHSKNIEEIRGRSFDRLVISGIPAVKWWANAHPKEDWETISGLLSVLKTVQAKQAILISTVDVYPCPVGVDESSEITPVESNAYGKHRYLAEKELEQQFDNLLVVRLPGLFGHGLKKNVLFDLLNNHLLEKINPAASFQYYSLDHLSADINRCLEAGLKLVNFATEPIATHEILSAFFPQKEVGPAQTPAPAYDLRSLYAAHFGGANGYLYSKEAVLADLGRFIEHYPA